MLGKPQKHDSSSVEAFDGLIKPQRKKRVLHEESGATVFVFRNCRLALFLCTSGPPSTSSGAVIHSLSLDMSQEEHISLTLDKQYQECRLHSSKVTQERPFPPLFRCPGCFPVGWLRVPTKHWWLWQSPPPWSATNAPHVWKPEGGRRLGSSRRSQGPTWDFNWISSQVKGPDEPIKP